MLTKGPMTGTSAAATTVTEEFHATVTGNRLYLCWIQRSITRITSADHFGEATVTAAKISTMWQPRHTSRSLYPTKPTSCWLRFCPHVAYHDSTQSGLGPEPIRYRRTLTRRASANIERLAYAVLSGMRTQCDGRALAIFSASAAVACHKV